MTDDDSMAWLNREVNTLEDMVEGVTRPLSADGGTLVKDVYGNLPQGL